MNFDTHNMLVKRKYIGLKMLSFFESNTTRPQWSHSSKNFDKGMLQLTKILKAMFSICL